MKAPKEGKRETSSSTQASRGNGGGGGSVNETGALFPRLHVKETKTVGPRAPPRNKMALYEQFTFPSHRYVPPSLPLPVQKPPTTYPPQRSSYESSMFYGPPPTFGGIPGIPGTMPWMPYSEMYAGSYFAGQPSVNGSCSSTIVDGEGNLGQESGVPASSAAGSRSPWISSHSNVHSISSKKARSNNDHTVPTYNPLVGTSHGPSTPAVGSDHCSARTRHRQKVGTASTSQPGSVSSDRQLESLGLATSRTNHGNHTSSGAPKGGGKIGEPSWKVGNKDQGEEDQSELRESTFVTKEKDSLAQQKSHPEHLVSQFNNAQYGKNQHQQKKGSPPEVSSGGERLKGQANSSDECLTDLEKDQRHPSNVSHITERTKGPQTREWDLTKSAARGNTKNENRRQDTGQKELEKQLQHSDCRSVSSAGSGDDLEITSAAEFFEVSQSDEGQSERGESDADEAEPEFGRIMSEIAPKDIVNAIGEQEFWRARKLILRQQKIFSAQLFELHRIIQVQQLLAASPDVGMIVSTGAQTTEASEPDQANHAQDASKVPQVTDSFMGDQDRREDATAMHATAKQPDSSGHSSTSDRVCDQSPVVNSEPSQSEAGQVPTMLNTKRGGGSTASWNGSSYSKAGATNNWFGAVPAPNGAYMYQPYPGSFHSSQVNNMGGYNGAYHPVMCPPNAMELPTMTHFGVPRYEQQPSVMHDMYGYNSYQQQQWPTAVFCPPVPPNPGANWYGMPLPMNGMSPTLRGPYGWYNETATAAHPSFPPNYVRQSHQSTAQPLPTACHPSAFVMHSPWGDSSNSQQQGGGEGERIQQQVQQPWPLSSEAVQTTAPVFQKPLPYSSDQDITHMGSKAAHQGGGPFGACEASAVTFQKSVPDSTSKDCEVSVSQQQAESGNNGGGWRRYDGNCLRGSFGNGDSGEELQHMYANKPDNLKRIRGSRQEVDCSWDKNGGRHSQIDSRKPPDSQMNALPLFPLAPALKGMENGKLGGHSSSGVIKAVPRAMVATAESTAEILLSIQSQRHQ